MKTIKSFIIILTLILAVSCQNSNSASTENEISLGEETNQGSESSLNRRSGLLYSSKKIVRIHKKLVEDVKDYEEDIHNLKQKKQLLARLDKSTGGIASELTQTGNNLQDLKAGLKKQLKAQEKKEKDKHFEFMNSLSYSMEAFTEQYNRKHG